MIRHQNITANSDAMLFLGAMAETLKRLVNVIVRENGPTPVSVKCNKIEGPHAGIELS